MFDGAHLAFSLKSGAPIDYDFGGNSVKKQTFGPDGSNSTPTKTETICEGGTKKKDKRWPRGVWIVQVPFRLFPVFFLKPCLWFAGSKSKKASPFQEALLPGNKRKLARWAPSTARRRCAFDRGFKQIQPPPPLRPLINIYIRGPRGLRGERGCKAGLHCRWA